MLSRANGQSSVEAFRRDELGHEAPQLDLIVRAAPPDTALLKLADDGPRIASRLRQPESGEEKPHQIVLVDNLRALGPKHARLRAGERFDGGRSEGLDLGRLQGAAAFESHGPGDRLEPVKPGNRAVGGRHLIEHRLVETGPGGRQGPGWVGGDQVGEQTGVEGGDEVGRETLARGAGGKLGPL